MKSKERALSYMNIVSADIFIFDDGVETGRSRHKYGPDERKLRDQLEQARGPMSQCRSDHASPLCGPGLAWGLGTTQLSARQCQPDPSGSGHGLESISVWMDENALRGGVRYAGPFKFVTYSLFFSRQLLGVQNAALFVESVSMIFSPLDAYWWSALAALFIISGSSLFFSPLGRGAESYLTSHSKHLLAFATALFTFIYAQGAKAKAMTLQPSVVPFVGINELEALLRQGRMQLLFPSEKNFFFLLVNNSESGPLKRLGDTFMVNPPMFRGGRSTNRMLHTHPHLVAVAPLASISSDTVSSNTLRKSLGS